MPMVCRECFFDLLSLTAKKENGHVYCIVCGEEKEE